jgi:hypothetical protein
MLERVCQFIGVTYSPTMLNYSNHSTYAPPDRSAIAPWRTELTPREIALVEIKTQSFLSRRGYNLSGHPLRQPGIAEMLHLVWTDKLYKWQFACRRYGVVNFVLEKLTRRLHRPSHLLFVKRIGEIDKHYLK